MQTTILSIKGLEKDRSLGSAEAYRLRVPALEVRRTEKVLLTGPSGSGKSTLLDMIAMILRPDRVEEFLFLPQAAGAAPFDAAAAWRADRPGPLAHMRLSIGYVLQTGGLLPFLSVRENIRTQRRLLGLKADDSLTASLIGELGISHLLGKLPATLSVGERQRVAIARALAADPALVLADEPTAALDPENAATVLAMFSRAVQELGASLILVTHAPEQVKAMRFTRYHVRTGRNERGEALAVLQPMENARETANGAEQSRQTALAGNKPPGAPGAPGANVAPRSASDRQAAQRPEAMQGEQAGHEQPLPAKAAP